MSEHTVEAELTTHAGVVTSADATVYLPDEPIAKQALTVPLDLGWLASAHTLDEVVERAIVLTDRGLPVWGWARRSPGM